MYSKISPKTKHHKKQICQTSNKHTHTHTQTPHRNTQPTQKVPCGSGPGSCATPTVGSGFYTLWPLTSGMKAWQVRPARGASCGRGFGFVATCQTSWWHIETPPTCYTCFIISPSYLTHCYLLHAGFIHSKLNKYQICRDEFSLFLSFTFFYRLYSNMEAALLTAVLQNFVVPI